jgi:hypothetical protein
MCYLGGIGKEKKENFSDGKVGKARGNTALGAFIAHESIGGNDFVGLTAVGHVFHYPPLADSHAVNVGKQR